MLIVMGTDGIPIEKLVVRPEPNLEAVAAEYTTLLRASVSAAGDTGLGDLRELSVVTERMIALLVSITAGVLPVRRPRPRAPSWAAPASPCTWPGWPSSASSPRPPRPRPADRSAS